MTRATAVAALAGLALAAGPARGATYMTQDEALRAAFPPGAAVHRETVFLTSDQSAAAARLLGEPVGSQLVIRYAGVKDGRVLGYAYFDVHRVRTLDETLMLLVTPDGVLQRIDVLSFLEPDDYLPRRRWLDQMDGHRLDPELSLNRAIRPLSGASLTSRAVVRAARRILALHQVIATAGAGHGR